jgi:hypothetical protein
VTTVEAGGCGLGGHAWAADYAKVLLVACLIAALMIEIWARHNPLDEVAHLPHLI